MSQTELVNKLKFRKPLSGQAPLTYAIYRDRALTDLVGHVAANVKLHFSDHNRQPHVTYTYFIVSIDSLGNASEPASIRVKGK